VRSAALVGTTVATTGAYFSDSKDASINASTGQIKVDISPSNGALTFTDLLPGDYQTQTIRYTAHPKGGTEDIWLVFPTDGTAAAFLSTPQKGPVPLGRYGHLGVDSVAGSFVSSNLTLSPSGYNSADSCYIDNDGHGGSGATAADEADTTIPYCAPRPAILLQTNLGNNATGSVDVTFGFTRILSDKSAQNMPLTQVVPFKIVATQHGQRP
jgi:hypothetical protein